MVNRLSIERRSQIIGALVEGNSIRSVERMTNTHRDTIMRLGVDVGQGCQRLMDEKMRNLSCRRLEVDEIWTFCRLKQRRLSFRTQYDPTENGDQWTFVALDPETKLVPSYLVGKRSKKCAVAFMHDLAPRITNQVQISADGLPAYVAAVVEAFGGQADFGQVVKFYDAEPTGPGRYSPPSVKKVEKTVVFGKPELATMSTSLVERQNLNMRMSMKRFTRLTLGFSKKLENLKAAVGLHFAHYNMVRIHKSLRITPAMAAGVEDRLWTLQELVEETSR
jgi:IS1 family transposase